MDWNEETNLLGITSKNKSSNSESSSKPSNFLESVFNKGKTDSSPEFNVVNKKGGWAEEGTKFSKNKSKSNLIERERFKEKRTDSEDDIPVIPDLEDLQDDLPPSRQMKTSGSAVNNLTYKELDFELSSEGNYPLANAKLKTKKGDVPLLLLTKYLHSEKDVKDSDVIWTMESLWNDIKNVENKNK